MKNWKIKMINLTEKEMDTVKKILKKYFIGSKILIFGSRLNGNIKKYSDLDIAVKSEKKIPMKIFNRAIEEFEYSDLNFRVDLLDYWRIDTKFRKIVDQKNQTFNIEEE